MQTPNPKAVTAELWSKEGYDMETVGLVTGLSVRTLQRYGVPCTGVKRLPVNLMERLRQKPRVPEGLRISYEKFLKFWASTGGLIKVEQLMGTMPYMSKETLEHWCRVEGDRERARGKLLTMHIQLCKKTDSTTKA